MSEQVIVITGSAGEIGSMLRHALRRPGRRLVLIDIADQPAVEPDENAAVVSASVSDVEAMTQACAGADAIVHMASLLDGATWTQYVDVNINGTYAVLEAARRNNIGRVVYASSHHAVGFNPKTDTEAPDYMFPRPDSYYGVAKVASEALGSLYHDRHGIDFIALRIASYRARPDDRRALSNWLSPDDTVRAVEASLSAPAPGFRVVWGVSNNSRRWMSLEEARAIGFEPQDDAEHWAEQVMASTSPDDPGAQWDHMLGGKFTADGFDEAGRS
ncbi:NAD(P)-dependent oxidoreductase [Mycolicibacterium sp. HK-90]|uniref:NAD-dependent epimerase/dehydratase family protein n=1 Tax=Mycolicibacterium sp. HK-90 TaxID=3056937 RepID=UPI002659DE78|nr:NAD(P)-dependent oxidoreductase [Mycolicibacterium sp. HK-90]WKG03959.1 NAD(P)-dependent oxidoreductase [Mycolicibacterium sp. HK-90]